MNATKSSIEFWQETDRVTHTHESSMIVIDPLRDEDPVRRFYYRVRRSPISGLWHVSRTTSAQGNLAVPIACARNEAEAKQFAIDDADALVAAR